MGDLPARDRQVAARLVKREEVSGYMLETLVLDLNGIELAPAYFVKPVKGAGPFPAILFNHSHGGMYEQGKRELLRAHSYLPNKPFAEALTGKGYAALCVDHWAFGERRGMKESEIFKDMLWQGRVMWGMMVYDSIKAIDYLAARPDVDMRRIGTMGISMGSTMAWWVAALDERVKACVDICCLTDYTALREVRGLDYHGLYYYVPSLLKHFSTADINALIAPRAHLALAGDYDVLTPPKGLDRIEAVLKTVYAAQGVPEAWKLSRYQAGHMETAAMREEIMAWLKKWL